MLVFPSCRFGFCFCSSCRFGRCLCSLVAVLVGACLAAFVRACSMVQKSRCLRTVAVGSVCGGRRLVGSFSWAGVGGLRVCFPGSGRDLSLMWGLPGRGSFFTPRRSVFLESHGHSFVPRNWPQICCCFWVCERIALFMGRPPHCRARNLAPHSGPLFFFFLNDAICLNKWWSRCEF